MKKFFGRAAINLIGIATAGFIIKGISGQWIGWEFALIMLAVFTTYDYVKEWIERD